MPVSFWCPSFFETSSAAKAIMTSTKFTGAGRVKSSDRLKTWPTPARKSLSFENKTSPPSDTSHEMTTSPHMVSNVVENGASTNFCTKLRNNAYTRARTTE